MMLVFYPTLDKVLLCTHLPSPLSCSGVEQITVAKVSKFTAVATGPTSLSEVGYTFI